ncbi:MAG TPA: S-adenosylmethionine decarboxylase, partial [Pseudomonas sp.]|nr:S-adenosylmethionine decarboxylase [Pseudomonas sp.]
LDNYLFGDATSSLTPEQRQLVEDRVRHEMLEIFYARNLWK